MTVVVPQYFIGKQVTAASCTPQSVSSTGTLTPATGFDLHTLGVLEEIEFDATSGAAEISPVDAGMENYVETKGTFTVKVTEIVGAGMNSNLLNAWYNVASPYFRFETDSEVGSTTNKFAVMATRAGGDITGPTVVEGKNVVVATFRPCGIPPYYGTGTVPF